MIPTLLTIIAVFTLIGLLYAERYQLTHLRWRYKPATSALFLLVGLSAGLDTTYAQVLFLGLVLCFLGDVFLIPPAPTWFLAGLVAFLLGHIAYTAAFYGLVDRLYPLYYLPFAVISAAIYAWLYPKLGDMRLPVLLYVVVITVMVSTAWVVFFEGEVSTRFGWQIALGATCFYGSDLAVALDKFVQPGFMNCAWGLPLYYLAQFILAFSLFSA